MQFSKKKNQHVVGHKNEQNTRLRDRDGQIENYIERTDGVEE